MEEQPSEILKQPFLPLKQPNIQKGVHYRMDNSYFVGWGTLFLLSLIIGPIATLFLVLIEKNKKIPSGTTPSESSLIDHLTNHTQQNQPQHKSENHNALLEQSCL